MAQEQSIPLNSNQTIIYCTGSSYTGQIDSEGKMTGFGEYHFPSDGEHEDIVYRGHFKDGKFHGRGMITNKSKFKMCGYFVNGKCTNYDMFFDDGLEYDQNDWIYCCEKDRRFWVEINQGIPPVGETFLTKEKPPRKIPKGHYDAEEGFFDPKTGYMMDAVTGNKICHVCPEERKFIIDNYRMNQNDFEMKEKLKECADTCMKF